MISTIIYAFGLTAWIYLLVNSLKAEKSNELRSTAILGCVVMIIQILDKLLMIMKG